MGNLQSMMLRSPALMPCSRCGRPTMIPPGHGIRLPHEDPSWCHEVVNLMSGRVHSRGDIR